MSTVTRKSTKPTAPRTKFIAVASSVNDLGEPYKPGQCAIAEYLKHSYPELERVFVDEDGRISFTDTLSGNRYGWTVRNKDYKVWVIGFDKGHAPDWELTITLEVKDAKVSTPAERKARSTQAREYNANRIAEGRPSKPGAKHGKRAHRETRNVSAG